MEQYNRHLKPEATDALTVSALEEESKTRKNGPMRFKPELANQRDFQRRAALSHHLQPPDPFFYRSCAFCYSVKHDKDRWATRSNQF
jgi:hypothetical protein